MDWDRTPLGAMGSTLAGQTQTQVAACLDAILHFAEHSHGDVVLKPDCNAAVDGLKALIKADLKHFCRDAGKWHDIAEALQRRNGTNAVSRVDAHADVKDYILQGMPIDDWIGNEMADLLAGQGAKENAVSCNSESNWFFLLGRAGKILRRAIAVIDCTQLSLDSS